MNYRELIAKASRGGLKPPEIHAIAKSIQAGTVDTYEALLVLGRSGAVEYRPLVEGFLSSPGDPMLARLALQILCRYWGLASEYAKELEAFIGKVDWDESDDVRLMAIDSSGELLRTNEHMDLLRVVYEIYDRPEERQIVREAAYCALATAVGKKPSELPPASRHFDLARESDPSVLAEVRRRLHIEENGSP